MRRWLVLAFCLSLPAVTSRIYASDEALYYSYLRSLWFDHDVSFDNEYRYFYDSGMVHTDLFRQTFIEPTSATGRRINFATVGCAVLWSPFYAVADVGVRLARAAGSTVPADGFSRPYMIAVSLGSAVYGFLSLLMSLAAACRVVPCFARASSVRQVLPLAAVWIGTPIVFYMYIAPPYSHACAAFAVSAFLLTWLRVRERWTPGGMAALGALAALMTMVREQDAFCIAGPLIDFAWTCVTRRRQTSGGPNKSAATVAPFRAAAAGVLAFAVAYIPQALVYLTLNARLAPSSLLTRKITLTSPHFWQVLLSPEHGLLFWTPIALIAFVGLLMLIARPESRRVAIGLLVTTAATVYILGSVESWTVAGAFGQRRFVDLTIVLVIGLAAIVMRAQRALPRVSLVIALVVGTWWNVALAAQFATGLMDRQRLEIRKNAWNAFVVVPRELPGLVYRYCVDRKSYYRSK